MIEEWWRRGFHEEKTEEVLKDIMYLTETMWVRLKPIKGLDR